MRMGGPMHAFKDDKISFVVAMLWDSPESRIHVLGEE